MIVARTLCGPNGGVVYLVSVDGRVDFQGRPIKWEICHTWDDVKNGDPHLDYGVFRPVEYYTQAEALLGYDMAVRRLRERGWSAQDSEDLLNTSEFEVMRERNRHTN